MTDAPNFRRGAEEAEKAAKSFGSFSARHFFSLEDKESGIIRLLTDEVDWIVVDQYSFVPTKPKPSDWPGEKWPTHMGAVSRSDKAFAGIYADDYIAEFMQKDGKPFKPSSRTWALACVREEVVGDGTEELGGPSMKGKVLGMRDKTREVTRKKKDSDDTETVTEKDIVLVNQAYKNFFSALEGFARAYHTVLDRDYLITRKGEGTGTDYQLVPLNVVNMPDGSVFDLRNQTYADRYGLVVTDVAGGTECSIRGASCPRAGLAHTHVLPGPDFTGSTLEQAIMDQSSDEYYGRFFDVRVTVPSPGKGGEGGAPAEQQAKPETDVTDDRLAAMASRVKGYEAPANGEAAPEGTPAAESTPAAAGAASGAPRNFD